jgi:hypothetical protein
VGAIPGAEDIQTLRQNSPANRPRNGVGLAPGRGGLGPYSRLIDRGAVGGGIDGRSREGRFLRAYEKMLTDHVGGSPSIVQRALISRAARLALHLELMDERSIADGRGFGPTDHHFYITWANALARHLARLGLEPAAQKAPTLAELFPNRNVA